MDNATLARTLSEVADMLEIEGANPFRIRAYRNAVRTVETQTTPLCTWVTEGKDLTGLQGIGKAVASHLAELCETGQLGLREDMAERIPAGLIDVTRLPGVGPKKARKLFDELGIGTVDELEEVAKAGKVREVDGFGAKSEAKIVQGIEDFRHHTARVRLDHADRHIQPLLDYLREGGEAERIEVAGSYRRRRETVGDVDLLAIVGDPEAGASLMRRFLDYPQVAEVQRAGDTRGSVRFGSGLQVDLRILPPESYGAALVYFTGSKEHNVRLRQRGVEAGLRISEYGVFKEDGKAKAEERAKASGAAEGDGTDRDPPAGETQFEKRIAGADEAEVYASVGLAWVPPELREDRGEIAAAAAGTLPNLVTLEDLRGDLQMHSTSSDGKSTIEEMLLACAERGYEYFALTDHSKALAMTGGLDAARVRLQWKEIAAVQKRHPEIRLLRSLEIDILADGSLDLEDELLAEMDVVLVSVHSRMSLPAEEQTARILKAVAHPEVDILAHPTGRRLGHRKAMDFDVDAVLEACAEHGVAVELNANPERLDLKDTHLLRARELGIPVVISTDAHSPRGLGVMRYGIEQARRAWLQPADVLNTLPLEDFLAAIGNREAG